MAGAGGSVPGGGGASDSAGTLGTAGLGGSAETAASGRSGAAGASGAGGTLEGGGAGRGGGGAAGSGGPDLSHCKIRTCLERLASLRAGCDGGGLPCVHERYGSQNNYCIANGVRMYEDDDGTAGLDTIIKPDGHTCYKVLVTYGDTTQTFVVEDPVGNVILTEQDHSNGSASVFQCDNATWADDGTSCGTITLGPFESCPDSTAGTCHRP